jgi:DnaJ-class molecular chaperone
METKDYYQTLGVDSNADPKIIKEAYRTLAFKYHPDRNKENPENVEKMKIINEAYAVLSNAQKRNQYDALRRQYGSSAYNQFRKSYTEQDIYSGSDIHHIFEEMAKSFGFRGFDEIFREFYGPGYRSFEFKRPGFTGRGFVFWGSFGPGGHQRKLSHLGQSLGRLSRYVLKQIGGGEFPEKGADIHDAINLDSEDARKGGPYAYYLKKKSKKLVVKVPAGIRDGQKIRLAGMGEEGKDGGKPGDLYLKVKIKRPLLQKVKKLIEGFGK